MTRRCALALALTACGAAASSAPSSPLENRSDEILVQIARDLEGLRGRCPQLAAFSMAEHLDRARQRIEFSFHTPPSPSSQPDRDGIWLEIRLVYFHLVPKVEARVIEGDGVTPCFGEIRAIVEARSAQRR